MISCSTAAVAILWASSIAISKGNTINNAYGEYYLSLSVPEATTAPTNTESRGALSVLETHLTDAMNEAHSSGEVPFGIAHSYLNLTSVEFDAKIPSANFNVLIKFIPSVECFTSACPTLTEFDDVLLSSLSVDLIFAIRDVEGKFFAKTNEMTIRHSSLVTPAPSTAPSFSPSEQPSSQPTLRPSTQPSTQPSSRPTVHKSESPSTLPTSAPKPRGPFKTYDEYSLSLVAPDATVAPTDTEAQAAIDTFGAIISSFVNGQYSKGEIEFGISDFAFKLESTELGEKLPVEPLNGIECLSETDRCPTPLEFDAALLSSLSNAFIFALNDLPGGYFSETDEAMVSNSLVLTSASTTIPTSSPSKSPTGGFLSFLRASVKHTGTFHAYEEYYLSLVVPSAVAKPTEAQAKAALDLFGTSLAHFTNESQQSGMIPFSISGTDFTVSSVEFGLGVPQKKFNVMIQFVPRIACAYADCPSRKIFDDALVGTFQEPLLFAMRDIPYFDSVEEGVVRNSQSLTVAATSAPSASPTAAPTPSPTHTSSSRLAYHPKPKSSVPDLSKAREAIEKSLGYFIDWIVNGHK